MSSYRITVDLTPLQAALNAAGEQAYRAVNMAVRMTAEDIAQQWQQQVYRLAPPYCRQEAVDSIKAEATGPFSSVVSSDSQAVRYIEEGTPQRDLKEILQTSSRVKVSNKGQRYLTIPFRHGTPTATVLPAMPKSVYLQASQLAPSRVTGRFLRPAINGGGVAPRLAYQWGGRLPAGLTPKLKPNHKADPHAGMVRFDTGNVKQRSSAYLTFRVMHQDSSGWIVPSKPGYYVARTLAAQGQKTLADRIGDILKAIGT